MVQTLTDNMHAFSLSQLVQLLQIAVKIKIPDDRLVNELLNEIANRLSGQQGNLE